MGACCGNGSKVSVNYKGVSKQLKQSTDLKTLISEVKYIFPDISHEFYLMLDGIKLVSDKQLIQASKKKSSIILSVVVKEPVKIPTTSPIFPLSQTLCLLTIGESKFSCLLLTPNYVLIPKEALLNERDLGNASLEIKIPDMTRTFKFKIDVNIDLGRRVYLMIGEIIIDKQTKKDLKSRAIFRLDLDQLPKVDDKLHALFYSASKPQLTEDRVEIFDVNQDRFSVTKCFPFGSQGGGLCDDKGKLKGVLIGVDKGRSVAIGIYYIISALQELALENDSKIKQI